MGSAGKIDTEEKRQYAAIDRIYRQESGRVLATLIRLLGDFDIAEEAMHDAFAVALEKWTDGIPDHPRAWLVSTGRFKAIDSLRRRSRFDASIIELSRRLEFDMEKSSEQPQELTDDLLRLIFLCCHPALSPDSQVAFTLREVCGLTTEEIARAFFVPAPTLAQRIVRAKSKIKDAGIPFDIPSRSEMAARLETVLHTIYLVFNEGYSPSSGPLGTRKDLSGEAIRLTRLVLDLLPEPEVGGLLALMLLHESRRESRESNEGELVLLEDQNRSLWDRSMIQEGIYLMEKSLHSGRPGPYTIQAAISALHARASSPSETDWSQIAGLYDVLLKMRPSSVVELNRAVAIAMVAGPAVGVDLIDGILARNDLIGYHRDHSARAELCLRAGRMEEAKVSYRKALDLVLQESERRYIEKRLSSLE